MVSTRGGLHGNHSSALQSEGRPVWSCSSVRQTPRADTLRHPAAGVRHDHLAGSRDGEAQAELSDQLLDAPLSAEGGLDSQTLQGQGAIIRLISTGQASLSRWLKEGILSWRRLCCMGPGVCDRRPARFAIASLSVSPSSFCRPEKNPFLLLESTFHAVQEILLRQRGRPLRRSWMDRLYGEEAITFLEEDVRPALKNCLARNSCPMASWTLSASRSPR
jgi:hypothetical protein